MSKLTRDCFFAMNQMKLIEKTQYLNYLIQDRFIVDFEDVGFCYWHISDNFALLRDSGALYSNHCAFAEHIRTGDRYYLYWLVSDATQRLTLETGGYSRFWWELYSNAVQRTVRSDYIFAEFCAHRAALYINPHLAHTEDNLALAISNYEKLLDRTRDKPEYEFYKIIYLSLVSRFCSVDYADLLSLGAGLFEGLNSKKGNEIIPGEWNSFIVPFSKYKQSVVGINSAINALIYGEKHKMAKEVYNRAIEFGMSKNRYIEDRLH